jgi:hypothetical protein
MLRVEEARGGARGGTCGGGVSYHGRLPAVGPDEERAPWSTGWGKSLGARRGGVVWPSFLHYYYPQLPTTQLPAVDGDAARRTFVHRPPQSAGRAQRFRCGTEAKRYADNDKETTVRALTLGLKMSRIGLDWCGRGGGGFSVRTGGEPLFAKSPSLTLDLLSIASC